jgi:hypothetical protein
MSGILYVFGLVKNPVKHKRISPSKDIENLGRDWENVGKDIQTAYGKYQSTYKTGCSY